MMAYRHTDKPWMISLDSRFQSDMIFPWTVPQTAPQIADHYKNGHLHALNETVGPKSTDHSFSYLWQGSASWIPCLRACMVQRKCGSGLGTMVYDGSYTWDSAAKHPGLFLNLIYGSRPRQVCTRSSDFYHSAGHLCFNKTELVAVLERHRHVSEVIDGGRIVRIWRETVSSCQRASKII